MTVTNKGIAVTNLNTNVYVNGNVTNQTTGFIKNAGSISINGDITNNSTTAFSDSSAGQIILNGTGQVISGTHSLNFHKVILNTTDTLILSQSIKITDSLKFLNGYLNLNGKDLNLDSTGYLLNERNVSHAFGATGRIIYTKYLAGPTLNKNQGGTGLNLGSSNNLGTVRIERTHIQQPAADSSVFRCYKVSAQYANPIDSISVSYFDDEKFKNEINYKVFSKKASGNNGWINRGGNVDVVTKKVPAQLNLLCDSLYFTVADETCQTPPDIHVTGVTNVIPLMSVDTITCTQDTLSVNAYSSSPNALITWKDLGDSLYANPLVVSAPNFYSIMVADAVNGCTNEILVNITKNKVPPLLAPLADSLYLNCSQPSIQLNGSSPTSSTSLIWTSGSFSSSNPATVSTTGVYHLTATQAANGCIATDSLVVGYKSQLLLSASNDTMICKGSAVGISATAIGPVSGVSYQWSNGGTSANTTVQPLVTTTYIVTANSTGCTGKDTLIVSIPPTIVDSVATFKPCNGTKFGTIVISAYGGIPPLQFSINNGSSYSPSGTFSSVPFGSYNIMVKDSLGCTKSNSAALNGFSGLPVPQFIASTQNMKGDTIVLVDISTPQPDSVSWILPAPATIIGGDKFNPVIYMPDTGAFAVTMIGYWSDCVLDTTKIIHFHPVDTTIATEFNNNGIKSVTLYPNPNNGNFTVGAEFYKKQSASIQVWGSSSVKYFQKNYLDVDLVTLPLSLGQLTNGTYMLRVIGEYNSKNLNFIINH